MRTFHDMIDDYLLGNLNNEDKLAFEKALNDDAELKSEFDFRQKISDGFSEQQTTEIKNQVKKAVMNNTPENNTSSNSNFKWWWIAIPIICLAAFWLFSQLGSNTSNEKIYAEFYEPQPHFNRTRNSQGLFTIEEELYQKYQAKDFQGILDVMDGFPKSRFTLSLRFIRAICNNEVGHVDLALDEFESLSKDQNILYRDQSNWSRALILIKQGKTKEAKPLLEELTTVEFSAYKDKAQEVLDKL